MNLETRVDPRLWQSIQNAYEDRNYTTAILDALHFLSDLIREKTGLESDGVALVGKAFGGKSPKLRVNKLQSESDWNVQKGIEQILRGIYQSIRNPRSHRKYNDRPEDADAVILFTNYLIGIINQAKSPFTKSAFLERVFDPDFVARDRYAELLVNEIPPKQRLEVFIDVYRQKEIGDITKLRYFVNALLKKLSKEEMSQAYNLVSDELKHTSDDGAIRDILGMFPASCWEHYEEVARLRIENKLIESIRDGRYIETTNKTISGSLGTWAREITKYFLLKDQLVHIIVTKLRSSDRTEQDYVFKWFFYSLTELADSPTVGMKQTITKGLKDGDKRFHDALILIMISGRDLWKAAFKEPFAAFQEVEPTPEAPEDDIPF